MRFTSAIVAGVFATAAYAQESSAASPTTSAPSTSVSMDPAQESMMNCIDACPASDVGCKADCITVPSPNEDDVNATTECVAKCDQGDGSPADTQAYADCQDQCINQNFFTTPAGSTPTGTNGGSAASTAEPTTSTASDGSVTTITPTPSSGDEASETGSGEGETSASASPTGAASGLSVGSSGLLGLLAAFLAL